MRRIACGTLAESRRTVRNQAESICNLSPRNILFSGF